MPYYFNKPLTKGLMKITVDQNLDTTTNAIKFLLQRELVMRGLIPVPDNTMLDELKKLKGIITLLDVDKLELCDHSRAYHPSLRKGYTVFVCEACGSEFVGDDQMDANNVLMRARSKNSPPQAKQECLDSDPESHKWDMVNKVCLRCNISIDSFYDLYSKSKMRADPMKASEEDVKASSDKIEQALATLYTQLDDKKEKKSKEKQK